MTAREMHYDFKSKINKVDSQQFRNLLVPEIDWKLNEAQLIYIRCLAEPRYAEQIGLQYNQRNTDDLRGIIKEAIGLPVTAVPNNRYFSTLPADYMYFSFAYVNCTKGSCVDRLRVWERRFDELHEESAFDKSSFEWREINSEIVNNTILHYTDGSFIVNNTYLIYIKIPAFIQNAQDFQQGGGQYYKADGVTLLTGFTNCELPSYTHGDIVDLAVAITSGDIQMPDYRIRLNKLKLTENIPSQ